MPQQVVINGVEFARRSESLCGELPVAEFSRLEDVLWQRDGAVKYALRGSVGSKGESLLRLTVEGVVLLQCQRCMEGFAHVLAVDAVFELLSPAAELTQEEVEDDTRDYLSAEGGIDIPALIEDEIILTLPVAPRHEDCSMPSSAPKEAAKSPFGVLAALKKKTH